MSSHAANNLDHCVVPPPVVTGPTRQDWIDVLKGMGIVCVVAGHVVTTSSLVNVIFMFHMPLFFLVGGWLHNAGRTQGDYLKIRATNLLLPYLAYLIILWPVELAVADPERQWNQAMIFSSLLKPMVLGGPLLKGFAAVFWFATCYFLTQQFVHWLVRRYDDRICTVIFAAMLACAYLNDRMFHHIWLPWNAHTVLFAAPLYYIGYRARRMDLTRYWLVFLSIATTGVLLNIYGYRNTLDMKYLDYGLPLVTLASAVACVALLALAAQCLPPPLRGIFAALGGASLTIMYVHQAAHLTLARNLDIPGTLSRIALSLLIGFLLHRLWQCWPTTRLLFLGQRGDASNPQHHITVSPVGH